MSTFTIARQIGIDMGHRVPDHGSKCRSPHGHRYTIEAVCRGDLATAGVESGMVMDFGFLKEEMMRVIDEDCDHAFCMATHDLPMLDMFGLNIGAPAKDILDTVDLDGFWAGTNVHRYKVYVVPFTPTAENLAQHWFERLAAAVAVRTNGRAVLDRVKVWETPNCWSEYPS